VTEPDADTAIDGTETMEHRWRRAQELLLETSRRLTGAYTELRDTLAERNRLKKALAEIAAAPPGQGTPCPHSIPPKCPACIARKALEGK
jgi:hypothetical protein